MNETSLSLPFHMPFLLVCFSVGTPCQAIIVKLVKLVRSSHILGYLHEERLIGLADKLYLGHITRILTSQGFYSKLDSFKAIGRTVCKIQDCRALEVPFGTFCVCSFQVVKEDGRMSDLIWMVCK